MDLFSDLQSAVQNDLTVGTESSLFPVATIKLAINRAYNKVGGLFRWPETEDAKKTSTVSGLEYYDYPENWRPDSIWKLEVDGVRYGETPDGSPLVFSDYLNWKEDNPNSTEKKWSNQWRRYFFWPIPTTNGDNNITVWGQKVVAALSADSDVTIFSYSMRECNEAIVLEAGAILKSKGEAENSAAFRSTEAKQIIIGAWNKIRQEQSKYAKVEPFFDVPNYYRQRGGGNTSDGSPIGNF